VGRIRARLGIEVEWDKHPLSSMSNVSLFILLHFNELFVYVQGSSQGILACRASTHETNFFF
jgi:hypothetical protein